MQINGKSVRLCFRVNADTAPATVGRVCDQQEATVFTHGKALNRRRDPPCESGDQPLEQTDWVLRRASQVSILAKSGRLGSKPCSLFPSAYPLIPC